MKDAIDIRRLLVAVLAAGLVLVWAEATPALSKHLRPVPVFGALHARAVQRFEMRQHTLRDSIVSLARAQLGARYLRGGTSPQVGFDCSGLVRYVFSQIALTPPRTARQQARVGAPIDRARLRPGDLLTFGKPDSASHIGIYVGDGKFIHASSVAGKVVMSSVDRRPTRLVRPISGARRLLATADGHTGG